MRKLIPIVAGALLIGACSEQEQSASVSFKDDVSPILAANCLKCHDAPDAKGTTKSGLRLDSYAGVMQGTKFGPVIDPGYPESSVLNQVIEGRVDKSIAMPHGGQAIAAADQKVIREWVEQGAKDN